MLATRLVLVGSPDPKSFHCYFVYTFCKDRINTFLILILIPRIVTSSNVSCELAVVKTTVNVKSAAMETAVNNNTINKHSTILNKANSSNNVVL